MAAARGGSHRQNLLIIAALFSTLAGGLFYLYSTLPPLEEELTFAMLIQDTGYAAKVLAKYSQEYYFQVLTALGLLYIFLQTFAVPGSISLSILIGALYGQLVGFPAVCAFSTMGACACYVLSLGVGLPIMERYFNQMLGSFRTKIQNQSDNLLYYLLFLRVSPLLPNWFINIASPLVDVPASTFFLATFLGLMPANWIAVQTGVTIVEMGSAENALNVKTVGSLFAIACVALIPTLIKKKTKPEEKTE